MSNHSSPYVTESRSNVRSYSYAEKHGSSDVSVYVMQAKYEGCAVGILAFQELLVLDSIIP